MVVEGYYDFTSVVRVYYAYFVGWGETFFACHSDKPVTIEPKDRIAQIVLAPYITASFNEVEELDDTERGEGGFGSTGTK